MLQCVHYLIFRYFFTSFTNNNLKFKSNIVPGESNHFVERKKLFSYIFSLQPRDPTPLLYSACNFVFSFTVDVPSWFQTFKSVEQTIWWESRQTLHGNPCKIKARISQIARRREPVSILPGADFGNTQRAAFHWLVAQIRLYKSTATQVGQDLCKMGGGDGTFFTVWSVLIILHYRSLCMAFKSCRSTEIFFVCFGWDFLYMMKNFFSKNFFITGGWIFIDPKQCIYL